MKVGIIQQANNSDIKSNINKLQHNIRLLASKGAELIVMQELHNGLYFCQTEDPDVFEQSETIPGPSTTYFGNLAKELGIVMVLSLFEKRAAGLYHNTAVVLEKDVTFNCSVDAVLTWNIFWILQIVRVGFQSAANVVEL